MQARGEARAVRQAAGSSSGGGGGGGDGGGSAWGTSARFASPLECSSAVGLHQGGL